MTQPARIDDATLGARALSHLQAVVAIDSQSDERSDAVPTTEGQRVLADWLAAFFAEQGATVERDAFANILAHFPGRGAAAGRPPVALLVHLDTARGTQAVPHLHVQPAWDGGRIPYPNNPSIQVDLVNYPAAAVFRGHDVVFGNGDFPFGLDDKLGLTHLMTLATLLPENPDVEHPPLLLVGRPDEEVGRHEAIVALAALFSERGVRHAYTIDGIWPFEMNVENFNAAMARVVFPHGDAAPEGHVLVARIGGVNTHGATAAAEGHRAAPRLVAEWAAASPGLIVLSFESDALRDCDAVVKVAVPDADAARAALAGVMAPHLPRGASWSLETAAAAPTPTAAASHAVAWLQRFYASQPGFTLGCEDSSGRDGYSHPFRINPVPGGLRLDVRIRDFDADGLDRRIAHVQSLAPDAEIIRQYVNMGPRLAPHPELVDWAERAAAQVGVTCDRSPIRGGTGVDPFLDRGIPVANLGTGYFSPESEKELTSVQMMAAHARWLFALVQEVGA
jgi:tripeptide aminopeptidase